MTPKHVTRRPLLAGTIATLAIVVTAAWVTYSYRQGDAAASVAPAALPQVVASKPLERGVDSSLGFLGQFSAVEQVELRAQVGGTLTGIHFKDGDIVHQGDPLFTIDPRPYEIRLAQANAQLGQERGCRSSFARSLLPLRLHAVRGGADRRRWRTGRYSARRARRPPGARRGLVAGDRAIRRGNFCPF